jgi:hypothetical protein
MWGCLFVFLGLVLMFAGYMVYLLKNPAVMRAAESLAQCQTRLHEVAGALDRYNADTGHMPATLDDLYPAYLKDKSNLRCPADISKSSGSSYVLRPGVKWGQGSDVVVYCPHHPAPAALQKLAGAKPMHMVPVILQDGSDGQKALSLDTLAPPPAPVVSPRR